MRTLLELAFASMDFSAFLLQNCKHCLIRVHHVFSYLAAQLHLFVGPSVLL